MIIERNRGEQMSEDLTDDQIALLCKIEEADPSGVTEHTRRDLEKLISAGYLAPTKSRQGSGFKLTATGIEFLGMRGVGLNEG
jgi:hypothetical protein